MQKCEHHIYKFVKFVEICFRHNFNLFWSKLCFKWVSCVNWVNFGSKLPAAIIQGCDLDEMAHITFYHLPKYTCVDTDTFCAYKFKIDLCFLYFLICLRALLAAFILAKRQFFPEPTNVPMPSTSTVTLTRLVGWSACTSGLLWKMRCKASTIIW